jgi:hypothetical protein
MDQLTAIEQERSMSAAFLIGEFSLPPHFSLIAACEGYGNS